ncbi:unnamed protein product [Schistocephalus solidus]|uniref:Secreted protein n=2 Tax=Schistocephalus solidus TaxID=70667 RepID=A0A183S9K4_SCHSO|nr:unnamed protein product [Schistocephalus solidus]
MYHLSGGLEKCGTHTEEWRSLRGTTLYYPRGLIPSRPTKCTPLSSALWLLPLSLDVRLQTRSLIILTARPLLGPSVLLYLWVSVLAMCRQALEHVLWLTAVRVCALMCDVAHAAAGDIVFLRPFNFSARFSAMDIHLFSSLPTGRLCIVINCPF